jgi:hypothetical protein
MDKDGTKTMGGDGGFGLVGMRHSRNGGKRGWALAALPRAVGFALEEKFGRWAGKSELDRTV